MYIMNKPFDIFKALGEENRFRIMALLVRAGREREEGSECRHEA